MSTGLSWTDASQSPHDLRALLAFRRSSLSRQSARRLRLAGALVVVLTVVAVLGPAYLGGHGPRERSGQILALLPSLCLGFLLLTAFSAVASGGGREVVPRDQAVAFPVSTTTEHLGALLMAPLNIAWMAQAWALLGATSYALGPTRVWAYEAPILLWVLASTAAAQIVGWFAEGVRRGRHGIATFRMIVVALLLGAVTLVVTQQVTALLDRSPTRAVLVLALAPQSGQWVLWGIGVAVLVVAGALAVVLGAQPADWALRRPMREELRLESGRHQTRRPPSSDLAMMLRIDRASVWRSVPLRRGLTVLALIPGGVALAGDLEWRMLTVLPGLVASGGALLFGVNAWCLDGRGALWRESLPVRPRVAFLSRSIVLFEVLLCSAAVTVVLASLRAGRPTTAEVAALLCSTLVVAVQVVAAGMRWSIARPFAVDLRSARATPAPPVVMAGYSARLALATTVTGLIFSGLAQVPDARYSLAVSVVLVAWSAWRLRRAERRWANPLVRSRVVSVVAG